MAASESGETRTLSSTLDKATAILSDLRQSFNQVDSDSKIANTWLRRIENVTAPTEKVVIGVIGATGSGKSSILNALLDQLQLIPTNCMRACTAVVTEISWNDQPGRDWRATIEFLKLSEWRSELEVLLGDLKTATGSIDDDESEAGTAFAKITAVYPHINKSNMDQINVNELLDREEVKRYLGADLSVDADSGQALHDQIKAFVDSKEKLGVHFGLDTSFTHEICKAMDDIEYWPLIRRVRIFGRAPVLQTGAVLVDLPGVADSNAARGAIAKDYLKQCSALFVVAPIIRAVDDKTARHLLGAGFKRQLHRDGTLFKITFICSKTDEIVIREARPVLNRNPDFLEGLVEVDIAKAQISKERAEIQQKLHMVRREFEAVMGRHTVVYKEATTYRQLKKLAADGSIVHPPIPDQPKSRKRLAVNTTSSPSPKKSRISQYLSQVTELAATEDTSPESDMVNAASAFPLQDTNLPPLSILQIDSKITELEEEGANLKAKKDFLKDQKATAVARLEEIKLVEEDILAVEWEACVRGRNEYAAQAIQMDFAAGIQDLVREDRAEDEETEATDADTSFKPVESLPVFCVSSQGYQKFMGQLEGEQTAALFSELEDTGIVQLRAHVLQLGKTQLDASEKSVLDSCQSLLTSLQLWSAGNQVDPSNTEQGIDEEKALALVTGLIQILKAESEQILILIEHILAERIFQTLPHAANAAERYALRQVDRWARSSRETENPGLHYATFKAMCRRDGKYANHKGEHNFARDLLTPFLKRVDGNWTSVFNNVIKQLFAETATGCSDAIKTFSTDFPIIMKDQGASTATIEMFEQQVIRFSTFLGANLRMARKQISREQKDANRLFEDTVSKSLKATYLPCVQEKGAGSYVRIKALMRSHVEIMKNTMFSTAADTVTGELQRMLETVREGLENNMAVSCEAFTRDCVFLVSTSGRDFETLDEDVQKHFLKSFAAADASLQTLLEGRKLVIDPILMGDDNAEVLVGAAEDPDSMNLEGISVNAIDAENADWFDGENEEDTFSDF